MFVNSTNPRSLLPGLPRRKGRGRAWCRAGAGAGAMAAGGEQEGGCEHYRRGCLLRVRRRRRGGRGAGGSGPGIER